MLPADNFKTISVPIDKIQPILNPVQIADLFTILNLTPASRRVDVMLCWSNLSIAEWSRRSSISSVHICRWIGKKHRIPLGAAVRLSKVIGISAELLFEDLIRRWDEDR